MADSDSTCAKQESSEEPLSPGPQSLKNPRPHADLDAALGRFSKGLALLETIYHAFIAVEQGSVGDDAEGIDAAGSEICSLELAVKELKGVYDQFDHALVKMANERR